MRREILATGESESSRKKEVQFIESGSVLNVRYESISFNNDRKLTAECEQLGVMSSASVSLMNSSFLSMASGALRTLSTTSAEPRAST
jgi:hypothetical protein